MIFKNIQFHNVAEIVETDKGFKLCRVPKTVRLGLNEQAREERAYITCGCELRFNMHSDSVKITLRKEPRPGIPAFPSPRYTTGLSRRPGDSPSSLSARNRAPLPSGDRTQRNC